MKYRPEIDGIRAIAVSTVILFHANLTLAGHKLLPGGFVGVDVFFVISGYLITLIILRELTEDRFSFLRFYERRIRRILPALLLVMAASVPFALQLMLPKALKEFTGSLISALFSVSNIWFWNLDDYFAEPSALQPFLHTWTLGVEEQLYIFFPILLLLAWKFGRQHIAKIMLVMFAISFAAAQIGSTHFPSANFYLLPTRAWELLAGGMLAHLELQTRKRPMPSLLSATMPGVGITLIVLAAIYYSDDTPYPSAATLAPVLGAVLLIWFAKKGEFVSDVLASKFFAGVGLISYGLYLWHFPIFAFAKISYGTLTVPQSILLILLTAVLSIVSYVVVETPVRNRQLVPFKYAGPGVAVTAIILLSIAVPLYYRDGAMSETHERIALLNILNGAPLRAKSLQDGKSCHSRDLQDLCAFNRDSRKALIVGFGDSYIDAISVALRDSTKKRGWGYIQDSQSGCPWIPDMIRAVKSAKRDHIQAHCNRIRDEQLHFVENLKSRAPTYFVYLFGNFYTASVKQGTITFENGATFESSLHKAFKAIEDSGHRLVLVYPIPQARENIPKKIRTILTPLEDAPEEKIKEAYVKLHIDSDYAQRLTSTVRAIMNSYPSKDAVRVDPRKVFCSEKEKICRVHDGTSIYYADAGHLSYEGSKLLTAAIVRAIETDLRERGQATNDQLQSSSNLDSTTPP